MGSSLEGSFNFSLEPLPVVHEGKQHLNNEQKSWISPPSTFFVLFMRGNSI
jgi:hypothetical protein